MKTIYKSETKSFFTQVVEHNGRKFMIKCNQEYPVSANAALLVMKQDGDFAFVADYKMLGIDFRYTCHVNDTPMSSVVKPFCDFIEKVY